MGLHLKEGKYLAKELMSKLRFVFSQITEQQEGARGFKTRSSLVNCLMSGIAVFGLKLPSLLQFAKRLNDDAVKYNLKILYRVAKALSYSYMRTRLDEVDPQLLRPAFTSLFSIIQRGKAVEDYRFLNEYILVACDGIGLFSSEQVHCANLCKKPHSDGRVGVLIHPGIKEVFPFCPELTSKFDDSADDDCEQNAFKRFLDCFCKEYPQLKVIFTNDVFSLKSPHIRPIINDGAYFIFDVNPTSNPSLFEWLKGVKFTTHQVKTKKEAIDLKFYNKIPLNNTDHGLEVNFIDCVVRDLKGKLIGHFTWVTNIFVTKKNVYELSSGGRARLKIENQSLNDLKSECYNFERNYGHEYQPLSHVWELFNVFGAFYRSNIARLLHFFSDNGIKGWIKKPFLADSTAYIYKLLTRNLYLFYKSNQ